MSDNDYQKVYDKAKEIKKFIIKAGYKCRIVAGTSNDSKEKDGIEVLLHPGLKLVGASVIKNNRRMVSIHFQLDVWEDFVVQSVKQAAGVLNLEAEQQLA